MLKKFHEDLERLGLRPRRQQNARRTFISLARGELGRRDGTWLVAAGARKPGKSRVTGVSTGIVVRYRAALA
ncbi:MAG TPA: hypothetical protein VMG58_08195 [Candidatus Sulfotelmatobacter sp.]|nr:hypothetical protein [Candidatus Sulfotelmatobacter sp.]